MIGIFSLSLIRLSTQQVLNKYININSCMHGQIVSFFTKSHPLEAVTTILNMQCRGPFREIWATWTSHNNTHHHLNLLRMSRKNLLDNGGYKVSRMFFLSPFLFFKFLIKKIEKPYLRLLASVTCSEDYLI